MIVKLIRCTKCNQVAPHCGSLGHFGESSLLPGVEWSTEDLENQREFFHCHRGHPMEELHADPDSYICDKARHGSMKVGYFQASNGQQRFLVKRTKEGLDRPAFYQLIPGELQVLNVSLKIQEDALRRQISAQNGSGSLTEQKIQKFIRAFQEEVENISPEKLAEEVELTQEGENPLLAHGRLKEAHWKNVLRRCQKAFRKDELKMIKQFIQENGQPEDVLSLLVKREISVIAPIKEGVNNSF
jgi:hypothetical protein